MKEMNKYKNQSQLLDSKIAELENKQQRNLKELELELDITYQEFRPSKLLTRALNDITEETEVKTNILESVLSLAGGYLSKRILVGKTSSIFKNLFGYGVQYFATKIISKNIKH